MNDTPKYKIIDALSGSDFPYWVQYDYTVAEYGDYDKPSCDYVLPGETIGSPGGIDFWSCQTREQAEELLKLLTKYC